MWMVTRGEYSDDVERSHRPTGFPLEGPIRVGVWRNVGADTGSALENG